MTVDASSPATSTELTIREAVVGDAAGIAAVYNQGIAERQATFETRPRSAADVACWLERDVVVVVAERGGHVTGFARVSPYSDRCVYAGVGEHGVYVDRAERGQGTGRALLEALAAAAEARGLYKLTSRVITTNAPSLALHRAAGFDVVGVQRRHGRLDGQWRDVALVERLIGDAAVD
jgi:phosphinothricin acetyltransferase